jgi:hypothetical protein
MPTPKRPWTAEDDRKLTFGWAVIPIPKLMQQLNRTRLAIIRRALDKKLGGLRRGFKSLARLSRETGYARAVLVKVAATLGIKFRRIDRGDRIYKTSNNRGIAISYDQEQAIIRYLKENRHLHWHYAPGSKRSNGGVWGMRQKPLCCNRCRRTDRPHYAKGLCHICYNSVNRAAKRIASRAQGSPLSSAEGSDPSSFP